MLQSLTASSSMGSAKLVGWIAAVTRFFQTGYVYHYAFTMIIGVFVLMTLWINRA